MTEMGGGGNAEMGNEGEEGIGTSTLLVMLKESPGDGRVEGEDGDDDDDGDDRMMVMLVMVMVTPPPFGDEAMGMTHWHNPNRVNISAIYSKITILLGEIHIFTSIVLDAIFGQIFRT